MEQFVQQGSIVRKIWGKADTVLFIFAGAAAEFALNKAVDWLYFTGRLPTDPLGRLFSTVSYARKIVFSNKEDALKAIDQITAIHATVEKNRKSKIPDWAYRDVLFMLIYYSIASFELMERKMTMIEKEEVYNVFFRMGQRMNLQSLPVTYTSWLGAREHHMKNDMEKSAYTIDLYRQYKKHLGYIRYWILLEGQVMVIPRQIKSLLGMRSFSWLMPALIIYKFTRFIQLDGFVKKVILPGKYHKEFEALDVNYQE
jgi:hypothetical protein